jgi:hypothetical protein
MKSFKYPEIAGYELVYEFCCRVVADEYDSFVENNEIKPLEKNDFDVWLDKESSKLYNIMMKQVNLYADSGEISLPQA